MNIFMCGPEERLNAWSEVRDQLVDLNKKEALQSVIKFWQQAPYSKNVIHPQDSVGWPTVWELLFDGEFCLNAIAYGMAMTVVHSELQHDSVELVMVACGEWDSLVVVVDDYVLGLEYDELVPTSELAEKARIKYRYKYSINDRKFVQN